jgi:hypothetical protein
MLPIGGGGGGGRCI